MKSLVLESWITLLLLDLTMQLRGFQMLRRMVLKEPVASFRKRSRRSREDICHALDLASVFYFRLVSPLIRSASATLVLRRHGWPAELVLGAQIVPYETYAWVEIEGRTVNDQPNLLELYQVLERY